ncbi:hypothetical protein K9N68_38485 (plasmid) [Kovacikia minuta CCNUW1]|uniref:hypothetical protein n=1 Tax=Kovacikia minuta TaxID=2931930 RepID=UPI001CCD17CC|nr:hypothetical protein [Kovacikia minuta]UBF30078.1 hypothetical protein K9N68_38485 [Kovacikia minuta CCNUW1]
MAKSNKFGALSAALKGQILPEQAEPEQVEAKLPEQVEAKLVETKQTAQVPEAPKRGRQRGKRSDPNYLQVGAYIPKSLDKDVKRLLIDQDLDFSELVTKLLQEWVGEQLIK